MFLCKIIFICTIRLILSDNVVEESTGAFTGITNDGIVDPSPVFKIKHMDHNDVVLVPHRLRQVKNYESEPLPSHGAKRHFRKIFKFLNHQNEGLTSRGDDDERFSSKKLHYTKKRITNVDRDPSKLSGVPDFSNELINVNDYGFGVNTFLDKTFKDEAASLGYGDAEEITARNDENMEMDTVPALNLSGQGANRTVARTHAPLKAKYVYTTLNYELGDDFGPDQIASKYPAILEKDSEGTFRRFRKYKDKVVKQGNERQPLLYLRPTDQDEPSRLPVVESNVPNYLIEKVHNEIQEKKKKKMKTVSGQVNFPVEPVRYTEKKGINELAYYSHPSKCEGKIKNKIKSNPALDYTVYEVTPTIIKLDKDFNKDFNPNDYKIDKIEEMKEMLAENTVSKGNKNVKILPEEVEESKSTKPKCSEKKGDFEFRLKQVNKKLNNFKNQENEHLDTYSLQDIVTGSNIITQLTLDMQKKYEDKNKLSKLSKENQDDSLDCCDKVPDFRNKIDENIRNNFLRNSNKSPDDDDVEEKNAQSIPLENNLQPEKKLLEISKLYQQKNRNDLLQLLKNRNNQRVRTKNLQQSRFQGMSNSGVRNAGKNLEEDYAVNRENYDNKFEMALNELGLLQMQESANTSPTKKDLFRYDILAISDHPNCVKPVEKMNERIYNFSGVLRDTTGSSINPEEARNKYRKLESAGNISKNPQESLKNPGDNYKILYENNKKFDKETSNSDDSGKTSGNNNTNNNHYYSNDSFRSPVDVNYKNPVLGCKTLSEQFHQKLADVYRVAGANIQKNLEFQLPIQESDGELENQLYRARIDLAEKSEEIADLEKSSVFDKQFIIHLMSELLFTVQHIQTIGPSEKVRSNRTGEDLEEALHEISMLTNAIVAVEKLAKYFETISESASDAKEDMDISLGTTKARIEALKQKLSMETRLLEEEQRKFQDYCKRKKKHRKFRLFSWKKTNC